LFIFLSDREGNDPLIYFIFLQIPMKLLFVCKWNAGRSQMAESFAKELLKGHEISSAGTHAKWGIVKSLPGHVKKAVKEAGYSTKGQYRKQLTQKMVEEADKVFMITKKSDWPYYVKNSPKVLFWDIPDPWWRKYEFHVKIRDDILELIENLKKQIG